MLPSHTIAIPDPIWEQISFHEPQREIAAIWLEIPPLDLFAIVVKLAKEHPSNQGSTHESLRARHRRSLILQACTALLAGDAAPIRTLPLEFIEPEGCWGLLYAGQAIAQDKREIAAIGLRRVCMGLYSLAKHKRRFYKRLEKAMNEAHEKALAVRSNLLSVIAGIPPAKERLQRNLLESAEDALFGGAFDAR